MYQHDPPGASRFDAPCETRTPESFKDPSRKFAGTELEDFLLAKALECFAQGWSEGDIQDRVSDWHILKAKAGAFLDDAEVEAIVERAAKVEEIAQSNVVFLEPRPASTPKRLRQKNRKITVKRPGFTGNITMEVHCE